MKKNEFDRFRKSRIWRKSVMIMKLTTIFYFVCLMQVSATVYSQATLFKLNAENKTVVEVLREIEENSNFRFFYQNEQVDVNRRVNINANNVTVEQLLDDVFEGQGISYKVMADDLVLLGTDTKMKNLATDSFQQKSVSGKVVDKDNQPLPGVSVIIKGTTHGTVTNTDGNYNLPNIPDNSILQFSFVGMKSQEIDAGNLTTVNVTLLEETFGIDEVVAIGYGTNKRRDIIGSVSSLSSIDIQKLAPSSVESTLQGMASGVQVNSGPGVPGAPQQIKIRGVASISSGTDPLWIVDGIPVVSGSMDKSYDGEVNQSVLSMINPNDIESISVLKDAAATSIYGSRGANGVILVTTKSGKKGEAKFNADIKTGISNWAKSDIGYVNNKDYMSIMDLAFKNSGASGYSVENAIKNLDGATETMTQEEALATNTNWGDLISRTGNFYEANLSASQGSDKGNSYLSLKYRKDEGNLKFNSLENYSANVNLNYKIFNSFDLGFRLMVSYTDNDRIKSGDGKAGAGGWAQINSNSLPWMKVYDPAGFNGYWNSRAAVNALASVDPVNAVSNLKTMNILSALNAVWHSPIKGLYLKGEFGRNFVYSHGNSWRSDALLVNGAVAQESKYETNIINYNAYINYDVPINTNQELNIVTGVENTRSYGYYTNLKGENLVGLFPEVGTPNKLSGSSVLGGETYLRGYFGRANYKLFDRYLAGVSVRRDGISKFSPENRWATFLSGSLGWIISDEKFFNIEPVSLLKLRGSYGQTGNTNVPGGITSDLYGINSGTSSLEGKNNTYLQSIGNSDIKWETTTAFDAGVDFGFLNNRINGSVAFYQQMISDMILAVSLPQSAGISGGNTCWQNIGDMKNQGIEFNIGANVMKKGDFKWDVNFNISSNKNEVLALDPTSDANNVGIFQPGEGGIIRTITKTGLPWGTYFMADYAGVDAQKGIPLIYEVETIEDGTTRHTGKIIPATDENMSDNRMILKDKSALPKIIGGFNTTFTYKQFDLGVVLSFVSGNYIYNRLLQSSMTPNQGMLVLNEKLLTESWTKAGDNAYWPQVVAGNLYYYDSEGNPTDAGVKYGSDNNTPSSQYLEKGDYLKIRNITLGYNVPNQLINKWKINNIRLYVTANNLFTFTKFSGYDPELPIDQASGGSYSSFTSMPSARTFMFGLNVNF